MASQRSPFTIDIDDLRGFQREVRKLAGDFPKELRKVNKDAAEIVAEEARARAPKLTGRLAKSIKAQASSRSAYVKAGTAARVPYASVIEFGWRAHGITANPYLYPAIAAKAEEVADKYGDAIEEFSNRAFPR